MSLMLIGSFLYTSTRAGMNDPNSLTLGLSYRTFLLENGFRIPVVWLELLCHTLLFSAPVAFKYGGHTKGSTSHGFGRPWKTHTRMSSVGSCIRTIRLNDRHHGFGNLAAPGILAQM